jgi:hypothetical protein
MRQNVSRLAQCRQPQFGGHGRPGPAGYDVVFFQAVGMVVAPWDRSRLAPADGSVILNP